MRKNMMNVLEAFGNRKSANGDSKRTCSTDGTSIFSYSTEIARFIENGRKVWLNTKSYSRTTNTQQNSVRLWASQNGYTKNKLVESDTCPE